MHILVFPLMCTTARPLKIDKYKDLHSNVLKKEDFLPTYNFSPNLLCVYSLVGRPCGPEEWTCKSHNGECIPLSWVCDDHEDCDDKSDEKDCSKYKHF